MCLAACTPAPGPVSVPASDPPPPEGTALLPPHLDCARWRYDGVSAGPLPQEWKSKDDRFTSQRDPGSARSPHRLCGQLGAAVDLAWGVETGSPDTVIAVLDSGIEWRDPKAAGELAPTAYLNRGELPVPRDDEPSKPLRPSQIATSVDGYDLNGDGRFSIDDYANDQRVIDRNGNEMLDPEDLILTPAFNDGVDSDGNGYVDDISGWDLLHDDNNPLDDVEYGHGTGEARDSTAAHNGEGAFGMCPGCSHLPVRVSDSFMAEGGRFAAGVLFALDSGASVVQEALGGVTNPPQAQQAIDAAYNSGVPVVASMADEQSQHANLPVALNHTIPVNSVTEAMSFLGDIGPLATGKRDTLALNGCTNFGAIAWVSVPSDGCSSEATGNSAGMVGLIESAARNAGVAKHPDLVGATTGSARAQARVNVLSANEVAQILRSTADDVDFSTPNAIDRANDMVDDFGQERFPSVKGWDATHGYGRINAYEAARAAAAGEIPPEADITSPKWFAMEPTSGSLQVEGRVAAVRSSSYTYRVEWTTGLQTAPYPAVDTWHTAVERSGLTAPVVGDLARLNLAEIAKALPNGGQGAPVGADGLPEPDRFTVRVRVVVVDAEGRTGTMHRHFMVHSDPESMTIGTVPGAGMSSPAFADLNGDGVDELIVGADDGQVHVLDQAGAEIPGFPVRTPAASYWHAGSPSARENGIVAPGNAIPVGAPAVADLNGDGVDEIVVTDTGGGVTWWDASGRVVGIAHTDPRFSLGQNTDRWNREKPGIMGSAALGDLDGDGNLEIVVAAMDRHVYAWHADSTPVSGFPVLLVDPAQVDSVDPASHQVTFRSPATTGIGGELIATPAVADLTGDGRPEIVVGAQEQYDEPLAVFPAIGLPGTSGNTRLYAISPDGTGAQAPDRSAAHPDEQAYLPGWPVKLPMLLMDVLPMIGGGVSTQVAIGDVDGDKAPEVVASSVSGQIKVLNPDGSSPYGLFDLPLGLNWLGAVGPGSNSRDAGLLVNAFGGQSIGRIGSTESLDIASTTSGLVRALDTLFTNKQQGDPQLTVWSGLDGSVRSGFPRVSADLSFFVTPAIVDVDGDGRNEAVAGNGVQLLQGESAGGRTPAGWPKLTGGWVVGTTGSGDWDGDGKAELAAVRRDGVLLVWRTPTDASAIGDWVRFGGNSRNDGTGANRH